MYANIIQKWGGCNNQDNNIWCPHYLQVVLFIKIWTIFIIILYNIV